MARGCCTARASNDTPSRRAAVWRSGQRLHFISTRSLVHPFAAVRHFPSRGNKRWSRWTLRPLEGETRRYGWQGLWALMKRRAERSPATMELVTLWSEISPLRSAVVEMTEAVSSRAEEHIGMGGKNLNLLNPMNPGRGAAHPAAPFRLAALATHPREGGGQVTWRRTLPSKLVVYGWRGNAKPPKAAL